MNALLKLAMQDQFYSPLWILAMPSIKCYLMMTQQSSQVFLYPHGGNSNLPERHRDLHQPLAIFKE